jgi:hypothetical protein
MVSLPSAKIFENTLQNLIIIFQFLAHEEEGIFRRSGSKQQVLAIKEQFDKSTPVIHSFFGEESSSIIFR